MARDYGNKRSTRQKGGAPQQFLVVIVTFLLGYLTACIVDVKTVSQWMNEQVLAHQEGKQAAPKATEQHQQAQLPPKPKFEFYTLLANEKGAPQGNPGANTAANRNVSHSAATPTQTATAAVTTAANNSAKSNPARQVAQVKVADAKPVKTPPQGKGSYLIQVASFKARPDAEHMKGMLILKGFDVNVVPVVTPAQGNWFRVIVGPYPNRDQAQRAQASLAKNERLHGMVRSAGG